MTIDVVTLAGVLGGLIGVTTFLLKLLISAKNDQLRTMEYQIRDLTSERDLFRGLAMMSRSYGEADVAGEVRGLPASGLGPGREGV